jgi:hypothetical protein
MPEIILTAIEMYEKMKQELIDRGFFLKSEDNHGLACCHFRFGTCPVEIRIVESPPAVVINIGNDACPLSIEQIDRLLPECGNYFTTKTENSIGLQLLEKRGGMHPDFIGIGSVIEMTCSLISS